MEDFHLRPDETRLAERVLSLGMVSEENVSRAAAEVRLIRRYGGDVGLGQRLADLGLIDVRQTEALAGTKDRAPAGEKDEPRLRVSGERPYLNAFHQVSDAAGTVAPGPAGATASIETGRETGEAARQPAGGFIPSWKRKKEQRPGIDDGPSRDTSPGGQERRVRSIIRRIVHSRRHERVLDFLIRGRSPVIEPGKVARQLGLRERQVQQVVEDLKASGLVKGSGSSSYTLSPARRDLEDLKFFFRLWQMADWHSKMLAWILEEERRG